MDINEYKENLKDLLPQGLMWPRENGTGLDKFLYAVATELARVDSRVRDMLREAYPLSSAELLEDWERVVGLPEPCVGTPTDVQTRRQAVHEKLGRRGGQSRQYFIDLAAKYGFTITIAEYNTFRAGHSSAGDPVNGPQWRFAWRVNAPETTIRTFKAGQNSAGDPLRRWGNELLECLINRLKPAHTHVIFAYGEIDED